MLILVYILIISIIWIMPYGYKKRKNLNINTLQKIDTFCNENFPRFKNIFVTYLENFVCFDEAFIEYQKSSKIYENARLLQVLGLFMGSIYGSIQQEFNWIEIDLIPNWVWALLGLIWSLVGLISSIWLFQYTIKFLWNYKFDYNWRYLFFLRVFFKIILHVLWFSLLLMHIFICLDFIVYGLCGFSVFLRIPEILEGHDTWLNVARDVADGIIKKFSDSGKEN